MRGIAIKLAILVVVSALVYSVFWFFKIGQVEKQINKFVTNNGSYISVGEVSVSGFPLSQKITIKNLKFSIPNAALGDNEVIVPHLEANAGIMASDYNVTLVEPASIQDADGNISSVEFTQNPAISVSIIDGEITKFSYSDNGYKIMDASKNVTYSASNTSISINSTFELEKITHKISINAAEIEGFDVVSLYKNTLEKKVIDGIKTGAITLGSHENAAVHTENGVVAPAADAAAAPTTTAVVPAPVAPVATVAPENAAPAAPQAAVVPPAPVENHASQPVAPAVTSDPAAPAVVAAPAPEATAESQPAVPAIVETAASNKSALSIELEYVLTPAKSSEEANTPPDPTQITEAPSEYNKVVKISNLEFTNDLYKISASGELSSFSDDNLPSGGVSVKVEKIDGLIGQLSKGFAQIAEKLKPAADASPVAAELTPPAAPVEDPYQVFLSRIVAKMDLITKEIAAKNAVSKDEIAQFDLRREKNLEFLINETSVNEILGKF
jgi:hypothetical protein